MHASIKKIEITNFRSLTSVTLNDVADMNVVFGENDVGKSNVLRALNLFLNDETAPGAPYRFEVDYPTAEPATADSRGSPSRSTSPRTTTGRWARPFG